MQNTVHYFNDNPTSTPLCSWDDNCLDMPMTGYYDATRMHDTLCYVQSVVSRHSAPYWTRIVEVNPCVESDPLSVDKARKQLSAFYEWGVEKGCYASAVIIPEGRFEEFSHIHAISEDAHNGVRVFFDRETAERWLTIQNQKHRRSKLH